MSGPPCGGNLTLGSLVSLISRFIADLCHQEAATPRGSAMTGVVTAQFIAGGGKKIASRADLDKVCDILGVKDPVKSNLPISEDCKYFLVLIAEKDTPDSCS